MLLTSKTTIKQLLKAHNLRPSKRLGQNFLIDKRVLKKLLREAVLREAEPLSNSVVVEVGPGLGTITQELAKRAKKVIAVEKDKRLCEILKENVRLWKCENVEIVQKDILKFNPANYKLQTTNYKLIGNLPFYLTAPVIRKFLESKSPPKEMVLIIQKEVAQRIVAKPPKMNLLAVSVRFYAQPKALDYISKSSFWPQPKVDSAIIKITPYQQAQRGQSRDSPGTVPVSQGRRRVRPSSDPQFREKFFRIVKAGFSHPRKKLINNLAKGLGVEKAKVLKYLKSVKIDKDVRAENLTLNNWLNLTKTFFLTSKKV